MGQSLKELDVSGSSINSEHLEALLTFIKGIRVLRISKCPNIDGIMMSQLSKIYSHTLVELYADKCPTFRLEPIMWLSGAIGSSKFRLGMLQVIDLAECPVEDKAIVGLASGCNHFRFINLYRCFSLTDIGVMAIVSGNTKLRVLNVACIANLTNKSMFCIADHCPNLVSLNISSCGKIGDKGIRAIATKCTSMQALNIAGLKKISEMSAFYIAGTCLLCTFE